MKKSDFHYELPPELIAQAPLAERSASRLLVVDAPHDGLHDEHMRNLPALLRAGDLLVFNDTRVIPARLKAASWAAVMRKPPAPSVASGTTSAPAKRTISG